MTNEFQFEKFPVYQKSEEFYVHVIQIFKNKKIEKHIQDQLKRAALSIVLNIAEGSGKYSKNDKKNFYIIAKGSVNECVALLRILKIEQYISEDLFSALYDLLCSIAKMLSGLIRSMLQRE
ncbi:MAG: four helix bundle protein [Candidatus Magasanikbacteria bacterium]|jgi:four helix bundle protein|nr:four helix bundle protein [Candidatus Magasanikbacteria bacterium]